MTRPIARPARAVAAPRPDHRRRVLLALAAALGSLTWVAAAGAQVASAASDVMAPPVSPAASVLSAVPAAPAVGTNSSVGATPAARSGPVVPQGEIQYTPRPDVTASASLDDKRFQDRNPGLRRNLALIGVGVAAMIIGSEVDDGAGTVLVLGGAGLSLYGFYMILR